MESTPLLAVIDAGGVGYEVHIPVSTAEHLPQSGGECSLFIHSVYREDSATLYGFAKREDRDFFRILIERVSGIGPKIGISMLSRMSVELLRSAISTSDVALLSQCPGIGKKTAERLIIELRDKLFANDADSYQYLAESIRMHPDQRTLLSMMDEAGFANTDFQNLTGGIVAVHRGIKP